LMWDNTNEENCRKTPLDGATRSSMITKIKRSITAEVGSEVWVDFR
jgi:hypothetical protein